MAEFLLRVVDKINPDPYLNTKCRKRGDVVAVCPDEGEVPPLIVELARELIAQWPDRTGLQLIRGWTVNDEGFRSVIPVSDAMLQDAKTVLSDTPVTDLGVAIDIVRTGGWVWGRMELSDPQYRIIHIPGMTVSEGEAWTAEEPETDPRNPSRMRQRNGFKFDLDHPSLSPEFRAWIADSTRVMPTYTWDRPIASLRAMRVRKQALPDPMVIG